ncbi:MAG: glycosyltransferase [Candidatus Electrothrix sp. AW1]|nr:glycosyltransferase [Candidatus Electrothrix sp. AX1]MCI5181158.1 glycosyltransferase [Candidatus Electrothrix gigas]
MSSVFIGMPVYNGSIFIERAVDSLRNQSYNDWNLLISDNASTDRTPEICKKYVREDSRIEYYRQDTNIGALANFRFLLSSVNCEYFMWAAADDMWGKGFVAACVDLLSKDSVDYAFTGLVNIDSFDRVIRGYSHMEKYFNQDRLVAITDYILDPECLGKANLIYGMYRYENVKKYLYEFLSRPIENLYAFDVALNLGIICRFQMGFDDRVMFKKRYTRITDDPDQLTPHLVREYPIIDGMDCYNFATFRKAVSYAVMNTRYSSLVNCLMDYRGTLIEESNLYRKRIEEQQSSIFRFHQKIIKFKRFFFND